VALA